MHFENKLFVPKCVDTLVSSRCLDLLSFVGITPKQMENEVSIMRKLAYHKNVMQLLDWNTAEGKTYCSTSVL